MDSFINVIDFAPADHLNRGISVRHSFNGSTARFDYGFDAANRIKYEQRDSGAADGFSFDQGKWDLMARQ